MLHKNNTPEKTINKNQKKMIKRLYYIILFTGVLLSSTTLGQQVKKSNFEKKAEEFLKANKIKHAAYYYNKAGIDYWNRKNLYDAKRAFKKSISIYRKLGRYSSILTIYTNMGIMYSDNRQLRKGLDYYQKSLEIRRQLGIDSLIASGLIDVADTYKALKQYELSIDKLNQALKIGMKTNDIKLLRSVSDKLAEVHKLNGNITKYEEYINSFTMYDEQIQQERIEQEKMAQQKKILSLQEYNELLEENERADELKKIAMKAELKRKNDSLRIAEKEKKFSQYELNLAEAEKTAKEAELKEEKVMTERLYIIITAGAALLALIGILLFMSVRNSRLRKKINKKLEVQNIEITKQRDEIQSKSLELETAIQKIEDQNKNITRSINYASRIQGAMLPEKSSIADYITDSFIFFRPCEIVSGDFYWFKDIMHEGRKKTLVSAVDCTGHGVPGAFMSLIGYNLLESITSKGIIQPNEILDNLNDGVIKALKQDVTRNNDGMDLALCLIDYQEKKITFSGAKNPLIYIQDGELHTIRGDRYAIGGSQRRTAENYSRHEVKLNKTTTFYMFSDGYKDQFGGKSGRKFLAKRFRNLLLQIHNDAMQEQHEALELTIETWMGDKYKQIDDILIIGFKITI